MKHSDRLSPPRPLIRVRYSRVPRSNYAGAAKADENLAQPEFNRAMRVPAHQLASDHEREADNHDRTPAYAVRQHPNRNLQKDVDRPLDGEKQAEDVWAERQVARDGRVERRQAE